MPYFECVFPEKLFKALNKLENADELSKKMLTEAIPIIEKRLKSEIRQKHTDTGELAGSIKSFEPTKSKHGYWEVSAAPTGRATGKRRTAGKVYARSKHGTMTSGKAMQNDDKLWFIEHGTSRQRAKPFLTKVTKAAEKDVINKMQEVFNREVGEE